MFGLFVTASYADTETVTWYKDGSVYDTTTCQTGDDISVPTAPTKRGHTFNGWVFAYDFSTLDASVDGTSSSSDALNRTWTSTFDYGMVSGVSLCSATAGTSNIAGTPDESKSGSRCWCKATAYKPTGSNITYGNTSSFLWVLLSTYPSASSCLSGCVSNCAGNVRLGLTFRQAVFGITQ